MKQRVKIVASNFTTHKRQHPVTIGGCYLIQTLSRCTEKAVHYNIKKAFLNSHKSKQSRGIRMKEALAEFLYCHQSAIGKVLTGKSNILIITSAE